MQYLNAKTSQGVETIDELNRNDFKTFKEYKAEGARLLEEYRLAFHSGEIYWSNRCTKEWRQRS